MSDLEQQRAAIVAKLQTVPGIGVVNDYERFSKSEKEFRAMYQIPGEPLQGGHVRRIRTRETSDALGRFTTTHEWRIRIFRALEDASASEKSLDEVIEAARQEFREDETLGGVVVTTVIEAEPGQEAAAGLQLLDSGPVMFCSVLCNRAEMALYTRIYL